MADQAGFLAFIRGVAGIDTTALPDASPAISTAYIYSIEVTNLFIECISQPMYDMAVYNLGVDYLLNWAPNSGASTYFTDARLAMGLNSFVAGVVSSSADESTSEALLVPDAFKTFMLSDLQALKTPFGRQYLAIAQRFGTLWGIT